jgi:syntaxin 7
MSFEDLESGRLLTSFNGSRKSLQEPSHAVASGVFQINTAVASFQRLVNSLGTPKDTIDLRQKLQKSRQQIQQMVKDTSAKLKQASEIDQHAEVSVGKKIADAKLTKDFQSVLREFQKAQRLAAEKETSYAPFLAKGALPSNNNAIELEITSIQSRDKAYQLQSSRQEFAQVDNEIVYNEAMIEEREEGIKEIHQQITEVNEIFKDLAVLVREQGAMIDDVSSNVENTHSSTTEANSQLIKAAKSQKSVSSMSCLLMVIFGIVLFIIVIVVMA